MSRGLAWLVLLPLLAASLSGCTAASDLQRFLDRAQGRVEYGDVELMNEQVDFAINDPPAPPEQGRLTVFNFTPSSAARSVTVEATVLFDEGPEPLPLALPVPRGQVRVSLISPGGADEGNVTFQRDGTWNVTIERPPAGEWGIEVVTFGQGGLRVLATANQPLR